MVFTYLVFYSIVNWYMTMADTSSYSVEVLLMCISTVIKKSMAFRGQDPVRTKIVIDNKIIEQVNSFNYLGNMISYEKRIGYWQQIT